MELTYLYHDGFLLRTPRADVVFDYWKMSGERRAESGEDSAARRALKPKTSDLKPKTASPLSALRPPLSTEESAASPLSALRPPLSTEESAASPLSALRPPLSTEESAASPLSALRPPLKPLYVVVSHFHKDHYNPEIFSWAQWHPDIHFIISKDVARHARHIIRGDSLYRGWRPPEGSVVVLRSGESWSDRDFRIDAFGSTDTGNSYVVTVGGRTVLHAGDLNAWIWKDESTPAEVASAIADYRRHLDAIAEVYPHLDLAMFPVDSRIGTDYFTGAAMLLRAIRVDRFVPMHFELADSEEERQRRHADALRFDLYANPGYPTEFVPLTRSGESVVFN